MRGKIHVVRTPYVKPKDLEALRKKGPKYSASQLNRMSKKQRLELRKPFKRRKPELLPV